MPTPASAPFTVVSRPFELPALGNVDVAGRAGFLVVFQSYCPPCAKGLTDAQAFATARPDVPVIGLDVDDLPSPAAAFLHDLHVDFASVAFAGDPGKELGIAGYPSVLAFHASGRVVAVAVGDVYPDGYADELEKLG